jgi:hypothetical protein
MAFRSRGDAVSPRGSSGGMDLGTRALVLGIGALVGSWIPLLNIVAFVAALMAVGFGVLARWPTGWITTEEPDPRRALWGIILGAVAIVVFVGTALYYSR